MGGSVCRIIGYNSWQISCVVLTHPNRCDSVKKCQFQRFYYVKALCPFYKCENTINEAKGSESESLDQGTVSTEVEGSGGHNQTVQMSQGEEEEVLNESGESEVAVEGSGDHNQTFQASQSEEEVLNENQGEEAKTEEEGLFDNAVNYDDFYNNSSLNYNDDTSVTTTPAEGNISADNFFDVNVIAVQNLFVKI